MGYSLVVHVDQPLSDVSVIGKRGPQMEKQTYESQPICIDIRLHKLVDITFHHPLQYHYKSIHGHRHT